MFPIYNTGQLLWCFSIRLRGNKQTLTHEEHAAHKLPISNDVIGYAICFLCGKAQCKFVSP